MNQRGLPQCEVCGQLGSHTCSTGEFKLIERKDNPMKTGWHNKSRKDKLADLASRCRAVTEKANAWDKLTQSIETLAEPEVPYTPKFRDMLLAILRATLGAVVEPGFPEQSVSRRFMCRRCYEVFDIDVPQARPKGYSVTCPKCGALTSNALEST